MPLKKRNLMIADAVGETGIVSQSAQAQERGERHDRGEVANR